MSEEPAGSDTEPGRIDDASVREEPARSDQSTEAGAIDFDPVHGVVVLDRTGKWVPLAEKPDAGPGILVRDQ